jgi:hypothetical protein
MAPLPKGQEGARGQQHASIIFFLTTHGRPQTYLALRELSTWPDT